MGHLYGEYRCRSRALEPENVLMEMLTASKGSYGDGCRQRQGQAARSSLANVLNTADRARLPNCVHEEAAQHGGAKMFRTSVSVPSDD